jgi:hypothetical protein
MMEDNNAPPCSAALFAALEVTIMHYRSNSGRFAEENAL